MRTRNALDRFSGYLFVLPYLVLFAGFVVLPLVFGLGLSFCRWEMLSPLGPQFVGAGNYREALGDANFWRAMRATGLFVVLTVPLKIALAMTVALGLASLRKRQALYRAAFFLPVMITVSVAGLLWRWFYSRGGLLNGFLKPLGVTVPWLTEPLYAMPSVVMMTLWWTLGGAAIILLAGLKQIPESYYEAAAIDGADPWQRFVHITLPLMRPVLLFVVVMNLIGSFQVFGQTFVMTRGGPMHTTRVLVQYIYETAFNFYRMGYAAAMSWLLFVVIAFFAFLQFRALRET